MIKYKENKVNRRPQHIQDKPQTIQRLGRGTPDESSGCSARGPVQFLALLGPLTIVSNSSSQGTCCPPLASVGTRHERVTQIYMQKKHP